MYTVYWIHLPLHKDIKSDGYVGITSSFPSRMKIHEAQKSNCILRNVIKKYGWNALIKEVVIEGIDLELALLIESELRPNERVGWNIQRGGSVPLAPFGKQNALGNKSRMGRIKYKIRCSHRQTNAEMILSGRVELKQAGFDPGAVYKCLYNGKSHKNYIFSKITLP